MRAHPLILVPLAGLLLFGQEESALPRVTLRVDTNVVLVPVTVLDAAQRMVTGLEAENFQVLEDGVPQKLVSFGSEDAPLSIGIVLDTSGSMGGNLAISRRAVAEFFKSANPEDEAFLVEFNNQPDLVLPFTHDLHEIENRIMFTKSKGNTALLDGITLSVAQMKKATNPRKALILVSDGGDNHSRYTEAEVRNRVKESDVQIYAMGIFSGGGDINDDPILLRRLAALTGGRHFETSLRDMEDVAQKIGIELRNTYLLGYVSTNKNRDGKYRSINVKVTARGVGKLTPSWRRGYFAPAR